MALPLDEPLPTPEECRQACNGKLHPMAVLGLSLFNQRQYWKAHEALEEAWKLETGPVRHLYRGILQVGVAYYHLQQGNYAGAMKLHARCQRWLDLFSDEGCGLVCRGILVAQVRADLETAISEARRLGPERLQELDPALFRPIRFTVAEHAEHGHHHVHGDIH